MTSDTIRSVATYVIAAIILVGSFVLIYTGRGDAAQAWLAVGAIVGYVFRDSAAQASTANVSRIVAAAQSTAPAAAPVAPAGVAVAPVVPVVPVAPVVAPVAPVVAPVAPPPPAAGDPSSGG